MFNFTFKCVKLKIKADVQYFKLWTPSKTMLEDKICVLFFTFQLTLFMNVRVMPENVHLNQNIAKNQHLKQI